MASVNWMHLGDWFFWTKTHFTSSDPEGFISPSSSSMSNIANDVCRAIKHHQVKDASKDCTDGSMLDKGERKNKYAGKTILDPGRRL